MERRSYSELKDLFNALDECNPIRGDYPYDYLMHIKVTSFLSKVLYGEKSHFFDATIEDGMLKYEGAGIDEDGEYYFERSFGYGFFSDYLFAYMKQSPHWDETVVGLYVQGDEEGIEVLEEPTLYEDKVVGEKYLRNEFKDFFDEEVYEDKEKMHDVQGYYLVDYDYPDALCVIKSSLYPYMKEFEERAGKRYKEEIKLLKRAFEVISYPVRGGVSSCIESSKYAYFLFTDNSCAECGSEYGCVDHKRAVIVAAELIEEIMFTLDKELGILPEEIRRKDEEWIKRREEY